uniref:UBX domain-containing protein n=1 Tax=Arcella intermedia TaxID=1963864 RepID=A0A6B2LBB3_9EUKA
MERVRLEEQRKEQERLERMEQERALQEIQLRESIRKKIRMEEERKRQEEQKKEMELLSVPKDRKPQVFAPSSTPFDPRSIEIPDEFYEVTAQDLKNNAIIAKKKKMEQEGNNQLKTKEMREKEKIKKLSKYKSCYIRVKFPDRVEVQAVFNPLEKPSDVYQFVEECLSAANKAVPFHLYTVPPKMIIEKSSNKNLRDLGFVPAVLMHFDINEGHSGTTPFLKEELIKDIKEKLPPPQVVVPKRDQIIEATPIVNEVKMKKVPKEEEELMEIVNPENEEKKEEKKLPAWFMKGKK